MRFLRECKRVYALARLYWGTPDYDWSTIALLMRHQIRRTREHVSTHQQHRVFAHDCRRMLIAETLLARILEDDYYVSAKRRYPLSIQHAVLLSMEVARQDREMLAKTLRHMPEWWD